MVEILRTNDLVLISVIESILKAERIAYFVADQHMAAVEGSLGFLPRRIWSTSARRGGPAVSSSRRGWEKNCAMPEPSAALERRGRGRADRGSMARRPAHAHPAEARPSGRHGRGSPRRGGGRRWPRPDRRRRRGGRRGRARAGEARARSRPSISSRSIPDWRGSPRAMRRATGFRRGRASCGSTRSTPKSAARRGWLSPPIASSPIRRSSTPQRSALLPTRARRERMSWPARRAAGRLD